MAKAKILIVDDDPLQLEVILHIVEREAPDYDVFQAANGVYALAIAQEEIPDIVITDWEMPIMNGIEFTKALKQTPETRDIPVIICSGVMTSSQHLKKALEAGASDYIRKPIDSIELIARIRSMIELSRSYQEIKQLNETKNEILSVIAHDLRGPVANLNQAVKMVLAKKLDADFIQKFMEMLAPQLHANYSLLNNLLLWAKNLRDNVSYQPEDVELKTLIETTFIQQQIKANEKEIALINQVKDEVYVKADKNMIATVLRNLVANALKFTPKAGAVTINAIREEGSLRIQVIDTGVGMSSDDIERIFNAKTVFSKTGTEDEKGTGLGLLLCKEFIGKHQSKLEIDSVLQQGSTFSFRLPLKVA